MNFESQVIDVSLDDIIPNRFQPRLTFEDKGIEELAASIKEHGVIQPLVLRRVQDKYEIIAGERRYKAATMAGLEKVPAIITDLDDNASAEVALTENIQRRNLTAIEEAKSYKTLLDRGYLTQDALAKKLGIAQATIANKLRLLNLDEEVQMALQSEKISERHARSLLQIKDKEKQKTLLKRIIEERLTVKDLDTEIKNVINVEKEVDETPLVDIGPSVEDIKTTAVDLNPIKGVPSIESLLRTNSEIEEPTQSPQETIPLAPNEIIPPASAYQHAQEITQAPNEASAPSTNRFFNFLEEEEANMDIGESPLATPSISNPTNSNNLSIESPATEYRPLEISPSIPQKESTPQSNLPATDIFGNVLSPSPDPLPLSPPNLASVTPSVVNSAVNSQPNQSIEILDFGESTPTPEPEVPQIMAAPPLIDPTEKIETLTPDNVPPTGNVLGYQLGDVINDIRDKIKSLEEKGIILEKEELDLDNVYQVIIKIDKKANQ